MTDGIHTAPWAEELGAAVPQVRSDVFLPPPDTPTSPDPSQPHLSLLYLHVSHPPSLSAQGHPSPGPPPSLLPCVPLMFVFEIPNPVWKCSRVSRAFSLGLHQRSRQEEPKSSMLTQQSLSRADQSIPNTISGAGNAIRDVGNTFTKVFISFSSRGDQWRRFLAGTGPALGWGLAWSSPDGHLQT